MYKVPLNVSTFGKDELNAAIETLNSGFLTMGEQCLKFENEFANYVGSKNAIFVNSGSSANLLAFFALANHAVPQLHSRKFEPGCEVIVPATSWSTSIWPIVQAGAVPVIVDTRPDTLQVDEDDLVRAISDKTVAICCVHVLGNGIPMQPILDIANQHGLWVIEDSCEALGTLYKDKAVGTWGDMGTYSFYFSHHISTIEGGMIVTDNDDLAELIRCLRAHGWSRNIKNRQAVEASYPDVDPRFLFINTGFNLRPTEINAALGLQQLKKLATFNNKRNNIAKRWSERIKKYHSSHGIIFPQVSPETQEAWFSFPVICKDKLMRNEFKDFLESNGIETRPIICGNIARQPAFQHIKHRVSSELLGANRIMDCGLCWGIHPMMSEDEIEHVLKTIDKFFMQEINQQPIAAESPAYK